MNSRIKTPPISKDNYGFSLFLAFFVLSALISVSTIAKAAEKGITQPGFFIISGGNQQLAGLLFKIIYTDTVKSEAQESKSTTGIFSSNSLLESFIICANSSGYSQCLIKTRNGGPYTHHDIDTALGKHILKYIKLNKSTQSNSKKVWGITELKQEAGTTYYIHDMDKSYDDPNGSIIRCSIFKDDPNTRCNFRLYSDIPKQQYYSLISDIRSNPEFKTVYEKQMQLLKELGYDSHGNLEISFLTGPRIEVKQEVYNNSGDLSLYESNSYQLIFELTTGWNSSGLRLTSFTMSKGSSGPSPLPSVTGSTISRPVDIDTDISDWLEGCGLDLGIDKPFVGATTEINCRF